MGPQFVRMLAGHPYFEISALLASKKSHGKLYRDAADWALEGVCPAREGKMTVQASSAEDLKDSGIKIAFSALPSDNAKTLEPALTGQGIPVFSNAGAHRFRPDVPIIIPEVNPGHFDLIKDRATKSEGYIVTNSNCCVAGIVLGLKPLLHLGLRSLTITTFQAVSGGGRRGVASFDIMDNIIPFIPQEENKVEAEINKIFGQYGQQSIQEKRIDINATCSRVPVLDGHLASLVIETKEDYDIATVKSMLRLFRGLPQVLELPSAPKYPIIISEEENRPQPRLDRNAGSPARARGMAVTIGRLRKKGRMINMFLLVHNTVRGAAGTCLLNAEAAYRKSLIPGLGQADRPDRGPA